MSHMWLEWAKRIQALSQSGLAFSKDPFDIERYQELRNLSVEIISKHSDMEMEEISSLFATDTGYQTPKVDVRAAVFKNSKILMVREKDNGTWSIPGGFCDVGLSPSENIIKEVKEESGYEIVVKKLLALWDMNFHLHPPQPFHYYKVLIQCEIIGGNAKIGLETSDIDFFAEDNLPLLSTKRNTESQIKMLFEFLRKPNKPALFD